MKIEPGTTARRSLEVTAESVRKFAEITGDYNPLHFDEEFARGTRFGRLLAQGGIATGLLHALVAMDLPGPGSVFMSQQWSFPKPVYIGDTITAIGTVKSWRASRSMGSMEFTVENQDGEVVLKGEATVFQVVPGTAVLHSPSVSSESGHRSRVQRIWFAVYRFASGCRRDFPAFNVMI